MYFCMEFIYFTAESVLTLIGSKHNPSPPASTEVNRGSTGVHYTQLYLE